ncbi:TetR/AcrR family transcriptional regulator [Acidithrix sp. C25]|uniref:TetR/AcrR family transcriptional regulator n=1 Tax=Acidithrix sp. C25 TaxID=1671482 RepID=UPI00191BC5E7|nr:TetR/AcrR family transcriptional regulator [Acidithrix sp. C25]CAG4912603.1 unnamed protein product [Acidithrix sp. C25]
MNTQNSVTKTRRRGCELEEAIFGAAREELCSKGLLAFSIERVAELSCTSKASIYRRWPNKTELVIAAVEPLLPRIKVPDQSSDLTNDLISAARSVVEGFNAPSGKIALALILESRRKDELRELVDKRIAEPRRMIFRNIMEQHQSQLALDKQELNRVGDLIPSLIIHAALANGLPINEDLPEEIVINLVTPLIHGIQSLKAKQPN